MPQKSYYHFWYESYSEKKSEITFWEFIELMILRIPEDDQLNTRNLFGRVHNICCDFHQQLTQT